MLYEIWIIGYILTIFCVAMANRDGVFVEMLDLVAISFLWAWWPALWVFAGWQVLMGSKIE